MFNKNSLLFLVPFILEVMNSIASTGLKSLIIFLKIQRRARSSSLINRSSRLVPERLTSIAGKILLSLRSLLRTTSIFPVPLNSSKITSSILLPVSINAVAIIVKLPPSSVLRAAPKNLFGLCNAFESTHQKEFYLSEEQQCC